MKKNQLFLGLATIAAAVFSFSSCSQDELSTSAAPAKGQEIRLMTEMSTTRSVSQTIQDNAIVNGAKIGVFVANTGKTASAEFLTNGNNNAFTSDGNGGLSVTSGSEIYFPTDATKKVDIYGYAPYQSDWDNTTELTTAKTFTVQTDQSTEANYLASDLLWAEPLKNQGNSENSYTLPFKHKLCKIIIKITNKRISAISLKGAKVYVRNTKTSTTINLADGTMGTASNVATITAAEFAEADITTAETTNYESASASIIIPEQTLSAGQIVKIVTAATETQPSTSLYASLATEKTLNASTSYDINVTIEPTAVSLTLGTSLTGWTSDGSATGQDGLTYGVGDYVLNDGTFLKNSDLSSATDDTKNKIIAVIFSTDVSANDQADYDGYAMGLNYINDTKTWGGSSGWGTTSVSEWSKALSDLDGRSKCNTMMNNSKYSSLSTSSSDPHTQAAFVANLSDYLSEVTLHEKYSNWFTPSIGQLLAILVNLGGATLPTTAASSENNSADASTYYASNKTGSAGYTITDANVAANINNKVAAVSNNNSILADGKIYSSVTEDETRFWMIKPVSESSNLKIEIGRNGTQYSGSNPNAKRSVIPVIAYRE